MLLTTIGLFILVILALLSPQLIIKESYTILQTFLTTLFPSLFFFLVLFKMLIQSNLFPLLSKYLKPLKYNQVVYALLGILLGFSGNALLLKEAYLNKQLSKSDLDSITLCVVVPSLPFCIFTIGSLLKDIRLGALLFFIQVIYALLSLTLQPTTDTNFYGFRKTTLLNSLKEAILSSGLGLYMMLGYILCISIVLACISLYLPSSLAMLLKYICEFASASLEVASSTYPLTTKLLLLGSILGFGSLNAHLQIYATLPSTPSYRKFLRYRIMQALFSLLVTYLYILKFL